MGSSDLTVRLLQLGLVDELRIMVSPVVPGRQVTVSDRGRPDPPEAAAGQTLQLRQRPAHLPAVDR
jgi:riboflavin biosynthesis pyrimidine reductase